MVKEKKASSFVKNVISIVFAQIAVKLLGFVYRTITFNVDGFGNEATAHYNNGFQIYTLLLAISSIGIPNAISKLVSERCALDDFKGAMRIFRIALVLFAIIGLFFSVIMFFGAKIIATIVFDHPQTALTIKVLSPAIFFVSVSSVIRGFFAGQHNMKATNTSQVLEQFLKCLSTILIVISISGSKPEFMAAGATLATTISTLLSLGYLFIFCAANKKSLKEKTDAAPAIKTTGSSFKIAKMILMVSIPISLGALAASLNRLVDSATVIRLLEGAFGKLYPTKDALLDWLISLDVFKEKDLLALKHPDLLKKAATYFAGMLGKIDVFINLPLALNTAFATVLVPTVAGALAVGDNKTAREKISFSLLISTVIALPCVFGYVVLAKPIFNIFYYTDPSGQDVFMLMAVTIFFSAMTQTLSGSLQGIGKIYIPALSVVVGGIVKLILNLILIPIPLLNIKGAAISSIACQAVAFFISFTVLNKNIPMKLSFVRNFLKPFFSAILMGGVVMLIYNLALPFTGNTIATLVSIGIGAIVYFIIVFALNVFTREELASLPIIGKRFKKEA